MKRRDPIEDLAHLRHGFGEHGGVNWSIEASTSLTVIAPETAISAALVRMSIGYTGTLKQRWRQLLAALEQTGVTGTMRS